MTKEQQEARKLDAEQGHIRELIDGGYICDKDSKEDFVFISYRSDDWEEVLYDIVYKLCKQYGLKVYFDTKFDEGSDLWIKQFYNNMKSMKCKAMLAFIDDKYYTSYATLMEMMASQTKLAGGNPNKKLYVLPVTIGSITDVMSEKNTGLGTRRYSNNKINKHWDKELKQFNDFFSQLIKEGMVLEGEEDIYPRYHDMEAYEEATDTDHASGSIYLNETICHTLMSTIVSALEKNDVDGGNKSYVEAIYDKLQAVGIKTVFDPDKAVGLTDGAPLSITGTKDNSWTYKTKKGADAQLLWDGKSKCCTVLANSKAAPEAAGFAALPAAKKLKDSLIAQGVLVNDCFVKDYECDKIATMINVLNGGSVSMPGEIKKGHLAVTDEVVSRSFEKESVRSVQPESEPVSVVSPNVNEPVQIKETPLIIPQTSNGEQTMDTEPERQASCAMSLEEFVNKYNDNSFTSKSFDQVQLKLADGTYTGEFCSSTRDLVWAFMMKLVSDNGADVIHRINDAVKGNNPAFIPTDRMSDYRVAYKQSDVMPEWAMCTNYSQYAWLVRLQKWTEAVGFDSRKMQLEFKGFSA